MADFNIKRIDELVSVTPEALDSNDLLVLYEDSGNTTNKVSVDTLRTYLFQGKTSLGIESEYDYLEEDKNLKINKAGIYQDNETIDRYFSQNGIKIHVNDDVNVSRVDRLKGFHKYEVTEGGKNYSVLSVNPVITIKKDDNDYYSDQIEFTGSAVNVSQESDEIKIDIDLEQKIPYEATDGTTAFAEKIKAGDNINFVLADDGNTIILQATASQGDVTPSGDDEGQTPSGDDTQPQPSGGESETSKQSFKLKTINLAQQTINGIINYYDSSLVNTITQDNLNIGDIIACNFNGNYVANGTIFNCEVIENSNVVKFVDHYAVFVVVNNNNSKKLLLMAADKGFPNFIHTIQVNNNITYFRTSNNSYEVLNSLPDDVIRLQSYSDPSDSTIQYNPVDQSGQRLNPSALPSNISYLENDKVPLSQLPEGVGTIVVNNQTVSLTDPDDPLSDDTIVFSSFETQDVTPGIVQNRVLNVLQARCGSSPNADNQTVMINLINSNQTVSDGSLIIVHNTRDWPDVNRCSHLQFSVGALDSDNRTNAYVFYEGASTQEGSTLPSNIITAGDTFILFYGKDAYDNHYYYILGSDQMISNSIRITQETSNTIKLEYQGESYSIPFNQTGKSVSAGDEGLIYVRDDINELEIGFNLPQREDADNVFLNGAGKWINMGLDNYDPEDIINEATQSFLLDLFYPIGSYFETCDSAFNPNDDPIWSGSGVYTWTNVNTNNVVDPEDSSKIIYKWRKDISPGFNDGNF